MSILGQQLGFEVDADALLRSHPFDGMEPSNAVLVNMGTASGLRIEAIKVKRGELRRLRRVVPAMLRFPDGRSLLLVRIDKVEGEDIALVRDPFGPDDAIAAVGEARLFETWQGDLLLAKRDVKITSEDQPFGLLWLLGRVLVEKKIFRDIALGALLTSIFQLMPAMVFMIMLDRVLSHHSFDTLVVLITFIGFIVLSEMMVGFIRRYLTAVATSRIDARLSMFVYDRLLNLPISFFEANTTGVISGKIHEIWRLRSFMTAGGFSTIVDSASLLILLPVMFALNWKGSFVVLALAGSIAVIYSIFLPSLRRQHGRVVTANLALRSHEVESIHGIRTVKSLALDGLKRSERDRLVAQAIKEQMKFDQLANYPHTLVLPLERFIYVGSVALACYMVLVGDNSISSGVIVAFSIVAQRVAHPLVALAGLLQSLAEVRGAVTQVASVVNYPPERGRSPTSLRLPIHGAVEFQGVDFRYAPDAPYALKGVTFNIPQGTIFGIMGRSGSGKTTVTRLLQGLHYDYEGMIKIDGMDLKEIDLDHLRSNVGVVLQENFLFTGTIRENIAAVRPNARFDQVVRAAQLAGAEEFIERMPRGYDTLIEEGAVNLSGGQRQRMAIARALLIDPPILILDEATSALDAESEAIVNANLMRIAVGRTVIIISHRLSSLIDSNAILVLERGQVYDVGTHDVLLGRCDIYKQLWYQQNRHLRPDESHVRIAIP